MRISREVTADSSSDTPDRVPAETTNIDNVALSFHPDYVHTTYPDQVILLSNDGTAFASRLPLLVETSPFFRDILTLPILVGNHELNTYRGLRMISLPSASKIGLERVLDCLRRSISGENDPVVRPMPDIVDALAVIEAYDIPLAGKLLADNFALDHQDKPLEAYAVAAAIGDERLAESLSTATLQYDISQIQPWAQSLLSNKAPAYQSRLYRLHARHTRAMSILHTSMMTSQKMNNGINNFTKGCLKHGGCPGFQSTDGDFRSLRSEVAAAAYNAIAAAPGIATFVMEREVDRAVTCGTCAFRFKATFAMALKGNLGDGDISI